MITDKKNSIISHGTSTIRVTMARFKEDITQRYMSWTLVVIATLSVLTFQTVRAIMMKQVLKILNL